MKILLLSPYHAKSHQHWCDELMINIPAQWTLLSLPARHFNRRIRSNSLTWTFLNKRSLEQKYDIIIATSMTDLNGLIGFNPHLAQIPSILYFHENQFAYPLSNQTRENVEPMLAPIYSALIADHLCFNSRYNHMTFIDGVRQLLQRFPDCVPKGLVEKLEAKTSVLPAPIDTDCFNGKTAHQKTFSIVWNHRWEYDKWPECFFRAMEIVKNNNIDFNLYVLGERFEKSPSIFEKAKPLFSRQIKQWGRVGGKSTYYQVLNQAHIVVSTAIHDFQGLSVMEGVAAGCIPVVPDRLSYREIFEKKYRYTSNTDDLEIQACELAEHIIKCFNDFELNRLEAPPNIEEYSWHNQQSKYMELIAKIINNTSEGYGTNESNYEC